MYVERTTEKLLDQGLYVLPHLTNGTTQECTHLSYPLYRKDNEDSDSFK